MGGQALNQNERTGYRVPLACYQRHWLIDMRHLLTCARSCFRSCIVLLSPGKRRRIAGGDSSSEQTATHLKVRPMATTVVMSHEKQIVASHSYNTRHNEHIHHHHQPFSFVFLVMSPRPHTTTMFEHSHSVACAHARQNMNTNREIDRDIKR